MTGSRLAAAATLSGALLACTGSVGGTRPVGPPPFPCDPAACGDTTTSSSSGGFSTSGASGGVGGGWLAVPRVLTEGSNTTANLYGIAGMGTLVVAVGEGGTILRRSGGVWVPEATPSGEDLRGVLVPNALRAVAVGDNATVLDRQGGTWRTLTMGTGVERSVPLNAVVADAYGDMVAVGGSERSGKGLLLSSLGGWTAVPSPQPLTPLYALAPSAGGGPGGWAFGAGGVAIQLLRGGTPAQWLSVNGTVLGACTDVEGNMFVVTMEGRIFRRHWFADMDLTGFVLEFAGDRALLGVGCGQRMVAVGEQGTVLVRMGTRWVAAAAPVQQNLWSAMVDVNGLVLVVGDRGTVLRLE